MVADAEEERTIMQTHIVPTVLCRCVLLLLFCGCVSPIQKTQFYKGPILPATQVATLRGDNLVILDKIDGQHMKFTQWSHVSADWVGPEGIFIASAKYKGFDVSLLPGKHRLTVIAPFRELAIPTGKYPEYELELNAEAGRTYMIELNYTKTAAGMVFNNPSIRAVAGN